MKYILRTLILAGCLLAGSALAAVEIQGTRFDDRANVGGQEVMLNGAGLRSRVIFKVYTIGLYLPAKQTTTEAALAAKGPKRLQLIMLMGLSADHIIDALVKQLHKNVTPEEEETLRPRVEEFKTTLASLKEAPRGTIITLDWLPGTGTQLGVNGEPKGAPIPGEDFFHGLMKIWLGNRPTQENLKHLLLGKGS